MKKFVIAALVAALPMAAVAQDSATPPADVSSYTLNAGDVLDISVWREDDLQRQVLVLPDGTISFPLAGQIAAAGKTTEDVQLIISDRLERYIPGAVVTVSVLNVSGNKVYVIGAVNNPGEFQVTRSIDVMQALSLAGGLTPFAGEDSIRILRRENGADVSYPFYYSDVKHGENLGMNIQLKSGDVIVVSGQSLF
jgi:polysaccharide export outer membrane protein